MIASASALQAIASAEPSPAANSLRSAAAMYDSMRSGEETSDSSLAAALTDPGARALRPRRGESARKASRASARPATEIRPPRPQGARTRGQGPQLPADRPRTGAEQEHRRGHHQTRTGRRRATMRGALRKSGWTVGLDPFLPFKFDPTTGRNTHNSDRSRTSLFAIWLFRGRSQYSKDRPSMEVFIADHWASGPLGLSH